MAEGIIEGLTDAGTTAGDIMQVRISETYDLSTQVGKLGLVGIHTPTSELISQMWSGLSTNHKYMRFVGCDVAVACASMLPADPLQVGVETGDIAPQDMFNPILYKAVSNDSYNMILNRIIGEGTGVGSGVVSSGQAPVNKNSIVASNDALGDNLDQFEIYYGLLAGSDGWRKAMPQAGFEMRGLYPIVFSLVSNMGNNIAWRTAPTTGGNPYNSQGEVDNNVPTSIVSGDGVVNGTSPFGVTFRGPSMRMPALPTWYGIAETDQGATNGVELPQCYVAMIVLPPAKLSRLYYRMRVTWTIEFTEPIPYNEYSGWSNLAQTGAQSYGTDYAEQSSLMENKTNFVDTSGTFIEKVMTSGK